MVAAITGEAYPTLTWAKPADITYGTALNGTQLNAAATYNATNVPGTFAYTPASGTVLNAGNNQTLSVTFTPTDTTSFLPVSTNVAINVLLAPLTITANSTNKVYGASLPTFTASYSGFVNSDSAANLTTPVSLNTTATSSSPVGIYAITASGATSTNYFITQVGGFLTNTPAALTITANNTNKVYGATIRPSQPATAALSMATLVPVSRPRFTYHDCHGVQPGWPIHDKPQRGGIHQLRDQFCQRHADHRHGDDHRNGQRSKQSLWCRVASFDSKLQWICQR